MPLDTIGFRQISSDTVGYRLRFKIAWENLNTFQHVPDLFPLPTSLNFQFLWNIYFVVEEEEEGEEEGEGGEGRGKMSKGGKMKANQSEKQIPEDSI